eukprot:3238001-Pyramimonas_sp.AAC.1
MSSVGHLGPSRPSWRPSGTVGHVVDIVVGGDGGDSDNDDDVDDDDGDGDDNDNDDDDDDDDDGGGGGDDDDDDDDDDDVWVVGLRPLVLCALGCRGLRGCSR